MPRGYHFTSKKKHSCGVCAIKTILKMYNRQLVKDVYNYEGLSPTKITNILNSKRIRTEIKYKLSYENLKPKSIIYYGGKIDHYVVVGAVKTDKIKIYDSDKERVIWLSRKTFEKKWSNWAIFTRK